MARRRHADAQTSRLAVWARRFAFFSLVATLLAILIVRTGLLEIEPALATFGGALVLAVIGIMLALAAFIVIWREGAAGGGYAFTAVAIGLLLLVYPAYLGVRAYRLPMINDITTDVINPPRFDVVARLRPRGTVNYAGLHAAEQQRQAYPDIEPLEVTATAQVAYDSTLAVITKRKWRIVVERSPQAGRRDGQIEAVARTPIMGFRDDVAVRIRTTRDGALIDVRSASRYGKHDLGANASRIRSLLEDVDEEISARTDQQERAARRRQQQQKPAPAKKPQDKR
jgi:uncharacterized protein (DUF1499 family)